MPATVEPRRTVMRAVRRGGSATLCDQYCGRLLLPAWLWCAWARRRFLWVLTVQARSRVLSLVKCASCGGSSMPKLGIRADCIQISALSVTPADPPGSGIASAVPRISRKRTRRGWPRRCHRPQARLARGHVGAGHVDRAQPGVVAEAGRLDLGAAAGLDGGPAGAAAGWARLPVSAPVKVMFCSRVVLGGRSGRLSGRLGRWQRPSRRSGAPGLR